MKIMDEEVKKQIYTAANQHAADHVDLPAHISRHHFVCGAIWAFSDRLIQGFLDQERPADVNSLTIKYNQVVKERDALRAGGDIIVQFHAESIIERRQLMEEIKLLKEKIQYYERQTI